MLDHQIEFSKACKEIYQPISGRASDPDSYVIDGNPEGIRACEEYEAIVQDLKASLKPELEMIEARIIKPADELLEVIKQVRKLTAKRDHKQLDYDRHNASLKKLQEKKDRQLKDEKALYKAENNVEQATQDYNYHNELLKEQLPELFRLEREFIVPLFQSFYYMQLNVFYTLHERMQSIDIGYFNLTLDIEGAFEEKRGDIRDQVESLVIVHFKTKGLGRPAGGKYGANNNQKLLTEKGSTPSLGSSASQKHLTYGSDAANEHHPPPPYTAQHSIEAAPGPSTSRPNSIPNGGFSALAKSKGAPPPPPPAKPAALSAKPAADTVRALFDYEAQAEGDLSFKAGEVITVVHRGASANEWWTGSLRGQQGQFPGKSI